MPVKAGSTIDPFAGGKLSMDEFTFKAAREVLDRPPGHPANVAVAHRIYYAAMVVEHRQRALEAAAHGSAPPKNFICPICRMGMDQNFIKMCFECLPCGRGISPEAICKMFQSNPVPFTAAPSAPRPTYVHSMWPTLPARPDPATYQPQLTVALPPSLKPDDLLDKIREDRHEQDEPVVMWRAWKMLEHDITDSDIKGEAGKRYLQSINGVAWPHKEPLRADHNGELGRHPEGECPNWHCRCGIYSVKTLVQAQQWGKVSIDGGGPVQILGKVVLWGRVLVFETGAKAEFAYPKILYLSPTMLESREVNPELLANELAAQYGIEVEVDDGMYNLGLSHS